MALTSDLFARCVVCESPPALLSITHCPLCRIELCLSCSMRHSVERLRNGDHALCRQIEGYAAMHAQMRMDTPEYREQWRLPPVPTPADEDYTAAHRAFAPALRRPS